MQVSRESHEAVLRRGDLQAGPMARSARKLLAETAADCRALEATLWLISPDGQHMDGTFNYGKTPQILESISVPVSDSVVGMVAASGLAGSIGPGEEHNESVDKVTGLPVTAMIVAPVFAQGKLCGALSAINPTGDAPGAAAAGDPVGRVFPSEALKRLEWKAFLMGLIINAHVEAQRTLAIQSRRGS